MHCLIIRARREAHSSAPTCSLSRGGASGPDAGEGSVARELSEGRSEGLQNRESESFVMLSESAEAKVVVIFTNAGYSSRNISN